MWVYPIIITLVTGTLLGIAFLYIDAWATGARLRPLFTLGWIKSILLVEIPLWAVVTFAALITTIALSFREFTEKKSASALMSIPARQSGTEPDPNFAWGSDPARKSSESGYSPTPATPVPSILNPPGAPTSSFEGDSLLISSPDQISLRISKVESGAIRGVQLVIENYRLVSIHDIRVLLSSACSFDSRHRDFRESILSAQAFARPNLIRPSSSGQPILLVWKAPQWKGLVTGENNVVRQLLWPDRDESETERWKLSLTVRVFDRPANAAVPSTPLKELAADICVLWNRARNEFSIENPLPIGMSPLPLAEFPTNSEDGVSRAIARFIMCGKDQLLAYTTTRKNLPGTRFLVVRAHPDKEPQYIDTPERDTANAKWNEWYQEWRERGFGGASGNGLDGASPF